MTNLLDRRAAAALEALELRVAAVNAADGVLLWRTAAFEAAMPGLARADAPPPGVLGLAEALSDARVAKVAVGALITTNDGRSLFDIRLAPSPDGGVIYLELHDAAERQAEQRRRLEDRERLLLTSRVLSVGEMASMLAHELNQPIGSVVNLLRGLKAKLARGALSAETGEAAIAKGIDQALYASGVIARIRTFVDQRKPQVEVLDLARLARDTLDLLDWEIHRDRIWASAELQPDLPPVLGDPVMIQQVLVNLARNALDAMRAQGSDHRLTVAVQAAEGGREVEVRIRDTGPGVGDAAAKMFSPFYSTKVDGMGVGLGLCRSIVELHGGRLWHSAPQEGGSMFHVALPRAAGPGGKA